MMDNFFSIAEPAQGSYKEKGSKFFSYAFPIYSISKWEFELQQIKKEHFKARHHCYAYRLGVNDNHYRYNDDGEPSGTAGKPIMGQIEKYNLHQIGIIVVRYFGGVKLGTSGLIRSYRQAALNALNHSEIKEYFIEEELGIECTYEQLPSIQKVIHFNNLKIVESRFEAKVYQHIKVRKSMIVDIIVEMKAKLLNRAPDDIDLKTNVPGCFIEIKT